MLRRRQRSNFGAQRGVQRLAAQQGGRLSANALCDRFARAATRRAVYINRELSCIVRAQDSRVRARSKWQPRLRRFELRFRPQSLSLLPRRQQRRARLQPSRLRARPLRGTVRGVQLTTVLNLSASLTAVKTWSGTERPALWLLRAAARRPMAAAAKAQPNRPIRTAESAAAPLPPLANASLSTPRSLKSSTVIIVNRLPPPLARARPRRGQTGPSESRSRKSRPRA